jgi:hypothetical protein
MEPDTTLEVPDDSPENEKPRAMPSMFQVIGTFKFKPRLHADEQTIGASVVVEGFGANEACVSATKKMGEGVVIKEVREIGIGSLGGMMGSQYENRS